MRDRKREYLSIFVGDNKKIISHRMKRLGIKSYSEYVRWLLAKDLGEQWSGNRLPMEKRLKW